MRLGLQINVPPDSAKIPQSQTQSLTELTNYLTTYLSQLLSKIK